MEETNSVRGSHGAGAGWAALARGEAEAVRRAAEEARELARVLALHGVALDPEAVVEDLPGRIEAMTATLWPERPLEGYRLHSSLGAHVIAQVAVEMVPAATSKLRHEPLRRPGLLQHLVDLGVDAGTAASVVGDWAQVPAKFAPSASGLSPSVIAGLAERTLTKKERDRALAQVAASPRCLARLGSTLKLLAVVRRLLPAVPGEQLPPELAVGVAALVADRPGRVLELFEERAETPALQALVELARARVALGRGEAVVLAEALAVGLPELETAGAAEVAPSPAADEDEDVLEIVEERIDPESAQAGSASGPPRLTAWGGARAIDEAVLLEWARALAALASVAASRPQLLGLAIPRGPGRVPDRAVPPDPDLLGPADEPPADPEAFERTERISLSEALGERPPRATSPVDPLLPPVRTALRAVVAAAEGRPPSARTVETAGDLELILRRARCIALMVGGETEAAREAVRGLPEGVAPEGRWAKDRALRYGERQVPLAPEEARPLAAALVADLGEQLARTIAGTLAARFDGRTDGLTD